MAAKKELRNKVKYNLMKPLLLKRQESESFITDFHAQNLKIQLMFATKKLHRSSYYSNPAFFAATSTHDALI